MNVHIRKEEILKEIIRLDRLKVDEAVAAC